MQAPQGAGSCAAGCGPGMPREACCPRLPGESGSLHFPKAVARCLPGVRMVLNLERAVF